MPSLSTQLATPAIWTPQASEEEWSQQVDQMLNRSFACSAFVRGEISPDDFAEVLFDNGYREPVQLFDGWLEGFTLLS